MCMIVIGYNYWIHQCIMNRLLITHFVKILCKCSNTTDSYVILVIFHEGIILMKFYVNLYVIYSDVLSTRSSNISEQNIQH